MPLAILILVLLLFAAIRGVDVFGAFRQGAADALPLLKTLLPTMAVFFAAMRLFSESGAQDALVSLLSPVLSRIGIDARLVPLILVRPVSGSAATGALSDLFLRYGPDSQLGKTASVLHGSSETVFYTLALYFGAAGVRKTRWAVPVALVSLAVSVVTGLLLSSVFFGPR